MYNTCHKIVSLTVAVENKLSVRENNSTKNGKGKVQESFSNEGASAGGDISRKLDVGAAAKSGLQKSKSNETIQQESFFLNSHNYSRSQGREMIAKSMTGKGPGTWLLRFSQSEKRYVISVLFGNIVRHVVIMEEMSSGTDNSNGDIYYFLRHERKFLSIYSLIQYYQSNHLSSDINTNLKKPINVRLFLNSSQSQACI